MAADQRDLISRAMSLPAFPSAPLRRVDWIVVWCNAALILLITSTMVCLVVGNVFCRYVLHFSLIWAEEISQYLMVWMVFLGAGLAFRQGRHVAVEMLQDALPGQLGRTMRWSVLIVSALFLAGLTVLGIRYAVFGAAQLTPATQIPASIPYAAVPVGSALFLFHLLMVAPAFVAKSFEEMGSLESGEDA